MEKGYTEILWKNYKVYKARASKREFKFDLPFKLFKELCMTECYICNKINNDKPNGIDRLDNEEGYTINNSFSCCWNCNRAKSNMTPEAFTNWIENFNPERANNIRLTYEDSTLKAKYKTSILDHAKNEELNNSLYNLNKNFMPKFIAHTSTQFRGCNIYMNGFFLRGNYFALFTLTPHIFKLNKETLNNIKHVISEGKLEYAIEFNYTPFNDLLEHIYVEYLTIERTTELLYPKKVFEISLENK